MLKDIIGYSRAISLEDGTTATKLFMRGTPRYVAGSRFKYTPDVIDFNYTSLVNAIGEALDKQMEEDGKQFFTDEKNNLFKPDESNAVSFDELMEDFQTTINSIIEGHSDEEFKSFWQPRIVQITEQYLGKGQLVSKCSRDQIEALDLIVTDLHELVNKNK